MDETPSRRRFLAAAGAVLFAGCSSGGDETGSDLDGRFDVDESTATATTRTATETATQAPVEINIETRRTDTLEEVETRRIPDRPPDEGTDTATRTPSQEERQATSLDDARARLDSALETFVDTGDGFSSSITDVQAGSSGLDRTAIEADIEAARQGIDRALESDATPGTRVAELRAFATYLTYLTEAQAAVMALHDAVDTAVTETFDENFGPAESAVSGIASKRDRATAAIDELEAETDPSATALVGDVSKRDYAGKINQMRAEVDSTTDLTEPFAYLREAMRAFGEGVSNFAGGGVYAVAQSNFIEAQNGFEIADTRLRDRVPAEGMAEPIDRATSAATNGVAGCESLIAAAQAGANQEDGELREKRRAAIEELGSSAEIRDSPSYRELVDP